MNIAMFGHKRIPSREGGIEVVVDNLSTRLVERGHAVTCYNRRKRGERKGAMATTYQGVTLKPVFTVDRGGLAAVTSSLAASIVCAFGKYDVVHIHAEGPAFMCWLPKLFGKKVVVTVHGLDYRRAKWGRFASWYILCGEKNAVKFADEIIVLSESVRDYFMTRYGRQTALIPNGVSRPVTAKARMIREVWGLEKDGYVLFVGRLVPEKGVHYLLEAWNGVKTDKKLVITGTSSDTNAYLRKLRASAGERVIFTGFQEGRALEELYSNAYAYCLPSDLEGMPLALMEAMSYGNCCLVSDIPECVEVVGGQGVTFQRGDAEDLRRRLQELCDSPVRVRQYQASAADYICGKYDWDAMTDETIHLYQENTAPTLSGVAAIKR